jgi:hypothetical protein
VRALAQCAVLFLWVGLAWSTLALAGPAPSKASRKAPETTSSLRRKAQASMAGLDFEAALPLLQQLLARSEELSPKERAEVQVELGVTYVNLGRNVEAQRAFEAALDDDLQVAFPAGISPKIRQVFESARASRLPPPVATPRRPPPPDLKPPPPPAPAPVPSSSALAHAPAVEARRGRDFTFPAIAFGVAALSGLVGAGTATVSNGAATELRSALHDGATAEALAGRQGTFAVAAYASYALAGVAAITGVSFIILGVGEQKVSAAAVLTGSGGAAALRVRF